MIQVQNICFSYGKRRILNGLSFEAKPGECVVFAGNNGAGKTTALSIIAQVLRPTSGSVTLHGQVGLVPQGTALFEDMSVRDNLKFFADLARCPVPDALPFDVERYGKTKISKLSGGMKKQVDIACALLGDPSIVLLDEPCAGLDIVYREEMLALMVQLKREGRTVICVSHEPMEFAPVYDKVIFFGEKPVCYTREQLSGEPADDARLYEKFSALFRSAEAGGERI